MALCMNPPVGPLVPNKGVDARDKLVIWLVFDHYARYINSRLHIYIDCKGVNTRATATT
jgi:hypothetical protein